jgi:hypothetical protein
MEDDMLTIKCSAPHIAPITVMNQFQGDLKKRSTQDIDDLKESLLSEGLLMPFALWEHEEKYYILDGHGRYEAIIRIALQDPTVLTQNFPAILVEATNEVEARKALLQIVSTYGKITKKGVTQFASLVPDYKAPVIKLTETRLIKTEKLNDEMVIIRVKVPKVKVEQLTELLKQVSGLEVY